MPKEVYTTQEAWFQPVLDYLWGPVGTAADIVHLYFNMALLLPLEQAYRQASQQLDRLTERLHQWTEQYGFEAPSGTKLLCPRLLALLVETLPAHDEEPLPVAAGPGGAPPIPFEALLRTWLMAPFYEVEDNAAAIWRAVGNNPRYLERCRYPDNHLPSERKFQQFNRVMNWAGLWGEAKRVVVRNNLETEAIDAPRRLAIDPGHQDGYAGVRRPCHACRVCHSCPKEERVRTCDVTDIVTKRKTYKFPGVKGVFVTDPDAEMPYTAAAVNARVYDGKTGKSTAEFFAREYPELVAAIDEATLDGAFDNVAEKQGISDALGGADVLAPINPRNRKKKTPVKDSRGVEYLDQYGVPHCIQGEAMKYCGRDHHRQAYVWGCPRFDPNTRTIDCPLQGRCCPNPGVNGRRIRIPRAKTPQIDWELPQHSQDFKDRYKARTAVERTIGRTKRSFPFERHWGRGRDSYQGHLDKGVLAFHVLMAAAHDAGFTERGRSPLTFHKRTEKSAA